MKQMIYGNLSLLLFTIATWLLEGKPEMEALDYLCTFMWGQGLFAGKGQQTLGQQCATFRRLKRAGNAWGVMGDRQKLVTVVDNLISNAIKHSPPGGMIALSLQKQGREAWLEVTDQGPGVPAADREKIFDWFYLGRGGDPAPSPVPGSGLGLPIARELAEAHHGQPARCPGAL